MTYTITGPHRHCVQCARDKINAYGARAKIPATVTYEDGRTWAGRLAIGTRGSLMRMGYRKRRSGYPVYAYHSNRPKTAISNIALEGTMTPETAAEWLQEQVETMLAERQAEE